MTIHRRIAAACLLVTFAGAAGAQQLGGAPTADVSLVRVFLALLVCLIIAVLAVLLVRQRLSGRMPAFLPRLSSNDARIRFIESRRISPQTEVALIEWEHTEYLIVAGPNGTLLLGQRPANGPEQLEQ